MQNNNLLLNLSVRPKYCLVKFGSDKTSNIITAPGSDLSFALIFITVTNSTLTAIWLMKYVRHLYRAT